MEPARRLNKPLFSDDDFSKVEQDVREAMALTARDNSVSISSVVPRSGQNTSEKVSKTPSSVLNRQPSIRNEAMIDVEKILKNILDKKKENIEDVDQSIEPQKDIVQVERENTVVENVPDFLIREKDDLFTNDTNVARQISNANKTGLSWKAPYALVGACLTILSVLYGTGYSTLIAIITMAPLVNRKFYKKS